MRIGIIGAGVAGLATAKVLLQAGHEVVVFDSAPDVGGVWSRTRRYPGLTTQSAKATYGLSDYPMPRDYPEWPTGAQVQAWLEAYAQEFKIEPHLRLSTRVEHATRDGIDTWLTQHQVPHWKPEALPSELYADASHPLTAGYEMLAKRMLAEPVFKQWLPAK